MRTPNGIECDFFYGNYFRGKSKEECRLIGNSAPPQNWTPDLCKSCPVPAILRANACPNMVLTGVVKGKFLNFFRHVQVTAYCSKTKQSISEPELGCGQCHPLPPVFIEKNLPG
jgi:hypothetical protein